MPTLDQAARQLGISEKTLRRWLALVDPPITPTPHRYDGRYKLIADEDVQRIRDARATLPTSPAAPLAPVTRSEGRQTALPVRADTFPIPTPPKRPIIASGATLPDGMMSKDATAKAHGNFPESTLRRWCDEGKIETDGGIYGGQHGQRPVKYPLTRRGLAQFYALASGRPDFQRCDACPHEAPEQIAE